MWDLSVDVCVRVQSLNRVGLIATLWTVAHQAALSTGLFRQEYWSGLPLPSPGDLRDPGTESMSLVSPILVGGFFTPGSPGKPSLVAACGIQFPDH